MGSDREDLELETEEEFPVGYRAWSLLFEKGQPRLGALGAHGPWEPETVMGKDPVTGEDVPVTIVRSDWPGEEVEPFDKGTHGLYMLKTQEELKRQIQPSPLHGIVYPFGESKEIRHGPVGFRTHMVKVGAIGRWVITCYVCGLAAKYFIHNLKNFPLCEKHVKAIEKQIKDKNYTQEEVETIIIKLARIYEADILGEGGP